MKTITILVGNIGSGKSTWILKNRKENEVVVSRDSLRYMFGGGNYLFSSFTEPLVWDIELAIVDRLMMSNFSIVVDETGMSRKMRERYIKLAKLFNYKIIVVEMPRLSMEECVNRRMRNPHQQPAKEIWETVWKKFDSQYEKPSKEEGIDEIIEVSNENLS